MWLLGQYETSEPCAGRANGVLTNQKSNSPQQSFRLVLHDLAVLCSQFSPVLCSSSCWSPSFTFAIIHPLVVSPNQYKWLLVCLGFFLPHLHVLSCIHYMDLCKGCCIFACNVVDCDSGFLDAVVMQMISRKAYGLKLKRFIRKQGYLFSYLQQQIYFLSYSNGNALESS